MASTYTTRIRLEKQGDGENPNTWGSKLNQNVIDLLDEAVAAYTTVSVSSIDVTLTANDGTADQSRSPFIELEGAVTTNINVIVPSLDKGYVINDNTTRSTTTDTITLKTAVGTGTQIKVGRISQFICDSVSIHPIEGYTSVGNVNAADSTTFTGINTFSNLTSFTSAASFNTSVSITDLRVTQGYINRVSVSAAEITNASVTRGIMTQVTLTDAASISLDLNTGNNFIVTLAGNRALSNPSNPTVGQTGHIYVIQDGTGVRTLSFGTQYKFAGGDAPTMTSAADSIDMLVYNVRTATATDVVFLGNFS